MPARTNRHQAVVFYVKQHIAPEGAEVTESKALFDVDSGKYREVDVVVDHVIGDDPVVISVEVTARTSRRADLPWVESMLKKHERMPTGRLVLVSWSGFTRPALQTIEQQGDSVAAVTPERIENAASTDLHLQQVQAPPDNVTLLLREEKGLVSLTSAPLRTAIYEAKSGEEVGTIEELVNRILNKSGEQLSRDVFDNKGSEEMTHFSIENIELESLRLCVELDGVRIPLAGFGASGPLTIANQKIEFEVWKLGATLFAMSEIETLMGPTVWVATPSPAGGAKISWRLL